MPKNEYFKQFDNTLAYCAVKIASNRHVGTMETQYTVNGLVMIQKGKDLTGIRKVVGTGGPVIHSINPQSVLRGVLADSKETNLLKPLEAEFYLDEDYILASMGLLAEKYPEKSLRIMKKNLVKLS